MGFFLHWFQNLSFNKSGASFAVQFCINATPYLLTDGTNQYIRGQEVQPPEDLLERKGLGVVTILIGVFSRTTGQVVAGVVNQPFVNRGEEEEGVWTGQIHWGFGANASAQPTPSEQADAGDGLVAKPKAVISNREADDVSDGLEASGFDVVVAAGAG